MFVHGDNLKQKENHNAKYTDAQSKEYLAEIREKYDWWKAENTDLNGPFAEESEQDPQIIERRVALFSEYKDFIDRQHYAEKFDSRSNLHSTVLEEFMYYLFRDLVASFSESALIGKAHTIKDFFFMPPNYAQMISEPNLNIEIKDHDFVIGVDIDTAFKCKGSDVCQEDIFQIPAVAIECKTYLDKTMLEGASTAAEQLKQRNPNAIYLVVAEWLKLTSHVNLKKFAVDQIYVLRKQKNTDREFRFAENYQKNPIYVDVVHHLFYYVRDYLNSDWEGGVAHGLEQGYLM